MENIEFFNIEEIKPDGTLLRFKEKLILNLGNSKNNRGRFYGYRAIGSEIRFKTLSRFFDITLQAYKEDSEIFIYFGDYFFKRYILSASKEETLHIEIPDKFYDNYNNLPFSMYKPNLIRIIIGYPGYVKFKELNTFGPLLKIDSKDKPEKKLLIYGSSISHGSEAISYVDSYAFILSRLLHIEVINKSIPGSCQAENEMIDYLKSLKIENVLIEYGVNVLSLFDTKEFKQRLDYIINTFKDFNLNLINIINNSHSILKDETLNKMNEFKELINKSGVHVLNDLLKEESSLSFDLLHPSNFGQMQIALSIKEKIKLN